MNEENKIPLSIKFEDYKESIINALKLIDTTKFFNHLIQQEMNGTLILGGPSIPMIALLGIETGRIYYFALKKLLPDIKI
jgi:hypothetical protein